MANIKDQVLALSSGTLAGLARDMGVENYTHYEVIDSFRETFIDFCDSYNWSFPNWREAYQTFSAAALIC